MPRIEGDVLRVWEVRLVDADEEKQVSLRPRLLDLSAFVNSRWQWVCSYD